MEYTFTTGSSPLTQPSTLRGTVSWVYVHYWQLAIDRYDNNKDPAFGIATRDVPRDRMIGDERCKFLDRDSPSFHEFAQTPRIFEPCERQIGECRAISIFWWHKIGFKNPKSSALKQFLPFCRSSFSILILRAQPSLRLVLTATSSPRILTVCRIPPAIF